MEQPISHVVLLLFTLMMPGQQAEIPLAVDGEDPSRQVAYDAKYGSSWPYIVNLHNRIETNLCLKD
jgi:hypothetical protein